MLRVVNILRKWTIEIFNVLMVFLVSDLSSKANLNLISYEPGYRSLQTSILRIDASGLEPSLVRRITGNLPGMGAGGGTEFLFNQNIPANLIQLLR